jgi:mRNA interferase MazF
MEKDFWKWHSLKSEIEKQIPSPLFYEREIWWCSVGANVGAEEDGKNDPFERPVLVLRKFNRDMFWGIPITSKEKYGEYYYPFSLHGESMTALLSQLRVLSAKRLRRRIGRITEGKCAAIAQALVYLIIP